MSMWEQMVAAEAWNRLVRDLKDLGPIPSEAEVISVLAEQLWTTEGITLDEDDGEAEG